MCTRFRVAEVVFRLEEKMFDILSAGQVPYLVPELKDWWNPRKLEHFKYMSIDLRYQYIRILERKVDFYKSHPMKTVSFTDKDIGVLEALIANIRYYH